MLFRQVTHKKHGKHAIESPMQKLFRFILVGCLLAGAVLGLHNNQSRYTEFATLGDNITDLDKLLSRKEKHKLQTLSRQLQRDYGLELKIQLKKIGSLRNTLTQNYKNSPASLEVYVTLSPKQITLVIPPLAKSVLSEEFLVPLKDALLTKLDQDKISEQAFLSFLEKIVKRLEATSTHL